MDKATFEVRYNDATTGLFKNNTTKDIGADDARDLVEKVAENVPFTDDDSYTWPFPGVTTTTSTTAFVGTLSPAITGYTNRMKVQVKIHATSTGSATINFNAVGAKKVFINPTTQAGADHLVINQTYLMIYDTALDTGAGGFLVVAGFSQDLQSVLDKGSSASSVTTDITVEGLENITIRTDGTGKTIDILNLDGPFLRLTSDFIISSGGVLYPWPGAAPAANGYVLKAQTDGTLSWAAQEPKVIQIAASDETTALTTGTAKITFRMPYAMTLTAVRASLSTTQTSGSILTVDINEGGSTILSTKLTIDNGEKTSTTAVTPPVISDTALADDAEITIDIDQVGDGTAKGLKITLIGT
jgi:hypothetical protein